ncbi:hypothetical protein [Bacillus piscicola]|uniref:hypothetical protein n=1 Tax=Bacillus piscicola TaxID=1632684 RepID=UPI001F09D10E|nr:hypothetical protein [Bacillus piscicola]
MKTLTIIPKEHVLFEEKWAAYQESQQLLAAKLEDYGIDQRLLDEVVESAFAIGELQADHAFVSGYEKAKQQETCKQSALSYQ